MTVTIEWSQFSFKVRKPEAGSNWELGRWNWHVYSSRSSLPCEYAVVKEQGPIRERPVKPGEERTARNYPGQRIGGEPFNQVCFSVPYPTSVLQRKLDKKAGHYGPTATGVFYLGSVPRVIFKSLLLLIKLPIGDTIISSSPFSMNPLGLELQMTRIPYEEPLPLANSLFHTGKALSPGMKNT